LSPSSWPKGGFLKKKAIRDYAVKLIEQYDVRSGQGPVTIARSMSGGNQQKAIVAREIDKDPQLLVAVQPTRGLDVGAIEYIHKQLVAQRDAGRAVLLVSLELDEVMSVPDRILVMYEGEIVGELDPKKTTVEELGLYMAGAKEGGGRAVKKDKYAFWKNSVVQSILASLLCIIIGLLIGYIVLLFINPSGAWGGITTILKNFFTYPSHQASLKYFGSTLVKTAPLLMCALSIQFSYKVGLFNIGAAGQYVAGAGACLFAALAWHWPWYACLLLAMLAGAAVRRPVRLSQGLLQRQRGHFRHHAQLDRPLRREHAPHQRQGVRQPLYPERGQLQLGRAHAHAGAGQAVQQQQIRHHRRAAVHTHRRTDLGHPQQDQASAMSSRPPASTRMPPDTAA
jgi:hypothetical protein